MNLSAGDVTGTAPGTTYYAEDMTTGTQYAVASFVPSAALNAELQAANVPIADGRWFALYNPYLLTRSPGGSWTLGTGGIDYTGYHCPSPALPAAVLDVWGQTGGGCHFLDTTPGQPAP